ncbi:MAG: hypothetical protein KIS66_11935 [Fimbriimonadaceae bacterium]|nr:hypothetical protein [Fimbriimonadaceae bacterium]
MRTHLPVTIPPGSRLLMKIMSSERADRYISEMMLPSLAKATRAFEVKLDEVAERMMNPYLCLRAVFAHYAFARRGKDRFELSELALMAMDATFDNVTYKQFLKKDDAVELWENFKAICHKRRRKAMEQLNRGIIQGLAELAQEIYKQDGVGSIAGWVVDGIEKTEGRVEPQFLRMVDVRGVGPKLASVFLRDVVYMFGLEDSVEPMDLLYIQPIDKWLRLIGPYIAAEVSEKTADWVLAGKLVKYTRRAEVSGIRFNMGATYFGMREVKDPEIYTEKLAELPELLDLLGNR